MIDAWIMSSVTLGFTELVRDYFNVYANHAAISPQCFKKKPRKKKSKRKPSPALEFYCQLAVNNFCFNI